MPLWGFGKEPAGSQSGANTVAGIIYGQQPFGGARGSGTNDKAGSYLNLLRWVSPRTIKETFVTPAHYTYPWNA